MTPTRNRIKTATLSMALLCALAGLSGCGGASEAGTVKTRRGAVVVEGCALDLWQQAALSAVETRQVVSEVVLRCLAIRQDGSIAPTDAMARASLRTLTTGLQGLGYQVSLAVSAQSDDGVDYPPDRLLTILSSPSVRSRATQELMGLGTTVSAFDLALPPLPSTGGAVLSQFATELAAALRPATRLGFFAPPSTMQPSELPGGAAVDLRALAPFFDRMRLLTTDYSCCDESAGPTTEPGWVSTVAQAAQGRISGATPALDVTLPLYGVDFSSRGQRSVSYFEAVGVAQHNGRQIQRDSGQSLHFDWAESDGIEHEVWFDDAAATISYQKRLDASLDQRIGILYYGLGSEDPSLFRELARRR